MASATALVVCSLLPWFGGGSVSRNGWANPLGALGVLLATLMVLQISLARHPEIRLPTLRLSWGQVHLLLGGLSFALILLQFLVGDRMKVANLSVTLETKLGIFLGLLASAGLAYGGFLARRDH